MLKFSIVIIYLLFCEVAKTCRLESTLFKVQLTSLNESNGEYLQDFSIIFKISEKMQLKSMRSSQLRLLINVQQGGLVWHKVYWLLTELHLLMIFTFSRSLFVFYSI